MRNNEFNQNMHSEFSPSMEQEFSRSIDLKSANEKLSNAPEFEIVEDFPKLNTEKNTEYAREKTITQAKKRKILKMMMATVGTVTILATTNVGNTSNNSSGDLHEGCIYSTEYNAMFEEIIELTESEDYITLARLVDSDQMENCIKDLYPDAYNTNYEENGSHSITFMYNGEYVTNCNEECSYTEYERDDINVFFNVYVNSRKAVDGSYTNFYSIFLTPHMQMTPDYITKEAPIDVVSISIMGHSGFDESFLNSYSTTGILHRDELIACGILEFPPSIIVNKLTLTGPGIGENFERYKADICVYQSDDSNTVKYLSPIETFTSEYWNDGPKGHSTAYQTWGGNNYYEYDFVIGEDGHAIAEQSYRSYLSGHINVNTGITTFVPTTDCLAEDESIRVYFEQIYDTWEGIFTLISSAP